MRFWHGMAGAAALAAASPAHAQGVHALVIPAGTLKEGADRLAAQTRSSIAFADPSLARLRIPRIAGRMTAEAALRRMISGLPVELVVIDPSNFRLLRVAARRPNRPIRSHPSPFLAIRPPPVPVPEIVVTASKRDTIASHYPGAVEIVEARAMAFSESAGTAAIERAVTSLSSTHLGSGRDKLFLRGIGDSSFSGHTQATVGQYFGEARLNYSGPDPDLRLYDIARAELLLGPQGMLYGAGSLGGIIRIEPNAPNPDHLAAQATLSASFTRHGAPGAEAAAMLNLPLGWREGAIRLVGYRVRDGGYVDDLGRGVMNSNRLDISGARGALAIAPAEGWWAEIAGIGQDIHGRDATYADRRLGRLSRASAIAQPYTNRFRLLSLTLRRDGDGVDAVANLSHSRARLRDLFDASQSLPDAMLLTRRDASNVTSAEARIGRPEGSGIGWLAGVSFVDSRTSFASVLSYRDGSRIDASAATSTREHILFGEATRGIGPLALSLGTRVARWRSHSRNSARTGIPLIIFEQEDSGWRLLPSAAALLALAGDLQLLVRHAASYRPPTAAASPAGVSTLSGDRYAAWEIGARMPPRENRPVAGSISLSVGRWRNVQADIFDNAGYLSASNIGDARIVTIEATGQWRLSDRVRLSGGATANSASVAPGKPSNIIVTKGRLPNVPDLNAQLAISYANRPDARIPFRLSTKLRYVGRSKLGIGPELGRWQGGFAEVDADALLKLKRTELFVAVANLFDSAGSRFALGSIAQAGTEELFVPQTPRTIRIGIRLGGP